MGKECMARLSRRLCGGTSLKTAAKEASKTRALSTMGKIVPICARFGFLQ